MKELSRCTWGSWEDNLMRNYHDKEWGVPIRNDRKIFEFLVLESFQAGLSWRTVLHKREHFRKAFANFDYKKVAKFGSRDVTRLMRDASIIRNRAKITAAITNAERFEEVRNEFGTFSRYMWSWVENSPIDHRIVRMKDAPSDSTTSKAWAKDLKRRGFRFLGPTVLYSHMQAVGMVNDHMLDCFRHREITR